MFKDLLVTFFFKKQTVCLFFYFVSLTWGDISDKILLRAMSEILLPVFFSYDVYGFGSNISVFDPF